MLWYTLCRLLMLDVVDWNYLDVLDDLCACLFKCVVMMRKARIEDDLNSA